MCILSILKTTNLTIQTCCNNRPAHLVHSNVDSVVCRARRPTCRRSSPCWSNTRLCSTQHAVPKPSTLTGSWWSNTTCCQTRQVQLALVSSWQKNCWLSIVKLRIVWFFTHGSDSREKYVTHFNGDLKFFVYTLIDFHKNVIRESSHGQVSQRHYEVSAYH